MRIGYVYLITNVANGKVYVGQTSRAVNRRWREHAFQKARSVSVLRNAINKHGIALFTVRIVGTAVCDDGFSRLNKLEEYFIRRFNSLVPNGYNLDSGGKNKNTHPQTRLRLSLSHKGKRLSLETVEKIRIAHTGRKHGPMSLEQKQLLSDLNKGKKLAPHVVEVLRQRNIGNTYGLGHKHSLETRAKMSASRKGKAARRGYKLSPAHKEALHSAWRGKHHSEESKQKISLTKKARRIGEAINGNP